MAEFEPRSQIRDVARLGEAGRRLLWEHGYEIGEGFIDILSQHQTLIEAARSGRLRHLDSLLAKLNSAPPQDGGEKSGVPTP